MAEKTFINNSLATFQITLFIREGDNPVNQDGTVSFTLNPSETITVTYGNSLNKFLNGILFFTISEGDLYSKIQFITMESELDDLLNTNDSITLTKIGTDYLMTGSNENLDAVNNAQTVTEMRIAIENPSLWLDLTSYNSLPDVLKDQVAGEILSNRPAGGYLLVAGVQLSLDAAINEIVNPDNIYVLVGSVGGDGSRAKPFGTITEGIAAVNPNGVVNILKGIYPITSQIVVNTAGITLKGELGTVLLLEANIIPLMILANNTIIDGLTMTSDVPYTAEFIQVGGDGTSIINNTIYGPEQALPMSTWVVNRAVVPQVGNTSLLVENNTFYSLRTGIYINPDVTGAINNNIVYNTKGAFLVDRALTTFVGNSWGNPQNEVDIALLAGTTNGPPYNDLAALSAENDNATISDQRNELMKSVENTGSKNPFWKKFFKR